MSGLPNVQQNNEQVLNDIHSLQKMEQQFFNTLETNPNLTSEEQKKIIEKMNQLSNMRVNLYRTLNGINNYFGNAVNTSVGSLKQQIIAIGIVESELNKAKKRLQILEEEKNNKIRLVQINDYYSDRYSEHSELMKIVILTLIPIIFFTFLNNKGFLPNSIFFIIVIIITAIGAYYFWKCFISIVMRDNMNYQTYNWSFDPNKISSGSTNTEDPWQTDINLGTCVGNYCCAEGTIYDSKINQCVPKSSTESFVTDSMVNDVLTKSDQNKNGKIEYNLREPMAYNN